MDWLKQKSKYFRWVREITLAQVPENIQIGQQFDFSNTVQIKDLVNVTGTTKGCGFAGVMRRHGYAGGRGSHGSTLGRKPGSLSFQRSQGKVIKNKTMGGHMGVTRKTVRNLEVVQIVSQDNLILIKGAMAGKPGSLVYVRKNG
jgi:large subunit ribosomal protein L3